MNGASRQLADFAAGITVANLPSSVRLNAMRTTVNVLGLSVGAVDNEAVERARKVWDSLGASGQATVLGRRERTSPTAAAFLNAMAAHVEDFDDTHLETVLHPGAPVVPAALAMAELCGASPADFLAGVVAGVEVGSRVALALGKVHFDRGWHVTGTAGHVGAAVAAARVARLSGAQTLSAMGVGATMAAGLQEALGTMVKAVHPGKAASDGLEAAVLAAEGVVGPNEPLEGRRGLVEVASGESNWGRALRNLGREWEIARNAFKPYACGIVSHPVIDAAVAIGARLGRDPSRLESVNVVVNPVVLDVMGVREPSTGLQSKFSVYHCFAVGYLDGAAGPDQYSDARASDPTVLAVREGVTVTLDEAIRTDECRARVKVRGEDEIFEYHVDHATGSTEAPMSDDDLRAKVSLVAAHVLGADGAERLFDTVMRLDQLESMSQLLDLSVPSNPGPSARPGRS
jgi:2-methylcitrate dehydratase PrpD